MDMKNCSSCQVSNGGMTNNNNRADCCPALMSDGRMTDYRPRCQSQYIPQLTNNISSSYDYRQFLIHNGADIIKENAAKSYLEHRAKVCYNDYDKGTMLPELKKIECNARTCTFRGNDPYGLGVGRDFSTDETDKKYRMKFLEEKEKENNFFRETGQCCGVDESEKFYYPIGGDVDTEYTRYAIPNGGQLLY